MLFPRLLSPFLFILLGWLITSCSSPPQKPSAELVGSRIVAQVPAPASPKEAAPKQSNSDFLSCSNKVASKALREGFALQQNLKSASALAKYQQCLNSDPNCLTCLYEIGWSHWKLEHWVDVLSNWEKALQLGIKGYPHSQIEAFIQSARENLELVKEGKTVGPDVQHPKVGSTFLSTDTKLKLTLVGKLQGYDSHEVADGAQYDSQVSSPKSVLVHPSGKKAYVNSLEAERTLVIDTKTLKKIASIHHSFTVSEAELFSKKSPPPRKFNSVEKGKENIFVGKPVEGAFTQGGKYLWVTYYRRSYDLRGTEPSAAAAIDTEEDKIVSVYPTGSISKYVTASPDGKWLAVTNWGDNTVSFINTSGNDPKNFVMVATLIVDKPLDLEKVHGNRDVDCGLCLRGETFTKDSKFLFVGRMKDGGIAVFSLGGNEPSYLGSVMGLAPGIRDILLTPNGETLYLSSNSTGFITRLKTSDLISSVQSAKKKLVSPSQKSLPRELVFAGLGSRTTRLSPDGRYLFVAAKKRSEVVVIDLEKSQAVLRAASDSFPVGLDITPDGKQLWVTAQTEHGRGGDSVTIYSIERVEP